MLVCDCPQDFVDSHINVWQSTKFRGGPHTYMGAHKSSWTTICIRDCPQKIVGVHKGPWVPTRLCELPDICLDAHGVCGSAYTCVVAHKNCRGLADFLVDAHSIACESPQHLPTRPLMATHDTYPNVHFVGAHEHIHGSTLWEPTCYAVGVHDTWTHVSTCDPTNIHVGPRFCLPMWPIA